MTGKAPKIVRNNKIHSVRVAVKNTGTAAASNAALTVRCVMMAGVGGWEEEIEGFIKLMTPHSTR